MEIRLKLIMLFLLLVNSFLYTQNDDYWLLYCDTTSVENDCGYMDKTGKFRIPIGKYSMCFTDTFYNVAIVGCMDGFCAIDKEEKFLYHVFAYDNGPDELNEGLRRIILNNAIGFADQRGRIVIEPNFIFVRPFENGLAEFCEGCRSVRVIDHTEIQGGKWGFIDKSGKTVVKPVFYKRWNSKKHVEEYRKERNHAWISKEKLIKLYGPRR